MKWTSHILGACMALVIALTAQSAAVARTMPDAAGQMVLCTGTGPMMVYFDENGEPTAPPHLCPDCALSLIISLENAELLIAASGAWLSQRHELATVVGPILHFGTPKARGPPVWI
ncbi:MAG: hypothetical protein WBC85_16345 [Planktotalea sp.]|uniref:hypothetical protein n=1 Tax=Planktotalea sp. TaxID=2029877 RepID=UPI003C725B70